ncbi:hypothetical protein [Candidatus Burkholderia verschuerenii]|uniref:hypothetical protein n=1 Tax=Candidatus Burkholderia verschuerenii TaxID=242163 RepID=UPI00067BCD48|nr:hypothetical protein [Candidatus Burkholderia verschuerenii]
MPSMHPTRSTRSSAAPGRPPPATVIAPRGWCTVQLGALLFAIFGACLNAAHVPADTLDAAAVMALTQTARQRTAEHKPNIAHDPHFLQLTPIGLELIDTRSRRPGAFERIDEYVYRNAEGDAIALLITPDPLAADAPHWRARRVGDLRLLSWTLDGKRYVLAGQASTNGLMRAADALTSP